MIDIRTANALVDGSCMECPPHEDRSTEIAEFQLGTFRLRLCPDHARNLEQGLERWRRAR